jgi:hypothetical protein
MKLKKKLVYLLIILFVLKYFWVINYFLFILYKHYTLYFPFSEVKESFRFLSFEWIDLRNYYNLLIWHNTLVDLSINNNIIYNDLLKNLYDNLSLYGFKISKLHNTEFKSVYWIKSQWYQVKNPSWKSQILKDTDLLNNLMKKQNKALSLDKYIKYRILKKCILMKLKIKFKVTRWNRTYGYYKKTHHINKGLKNIFDNRIAVWNESMYNMNSYKLFKNALPLKEVIKDRLSFLSYYYRGTLRKKISNKFISIPISKYTRLRNMPLNKFILEYKKNVHLKNFSEILNLLNKSIYLSQKESRSWWFKYYRRVVKKIRLSYYKIFYPNNLSHHLYFFKRIYNYRIYKNNMGLKNKIPTYNWAETIWKKRIAKSVFNLYGLTSTPETFTLNTYHDLAKQNILVKPRYFYQYIYTKYPYRLNKYNNILNSNLNYFNLLTKDVKIIKKYLFLENLKKRYCFKFHNNFYEMNKLYSSIMLKKFKNWNQPFLYKYFKLYDLKKTKKGYEDYSFERLKYWNFFDYLKINKYYMYKYEDIYKNKNNYINLYFIKRFRKDYINHRNLLIRFMSAYFYYEYFKKVVLLNKLKPMKGRNIKVINFRLKWNFNVYLNHKKQKAEYAKYILVLCKMFQDKFEMYHQYIHSKVNSHNKIYEKNIKTYKINVLNRISNLKRFFYYRNKRFNGWAIWNYFRSFSLKFHIKHLLWHSPYSYLFFSNQNNNVNNNLNVIKSKSIFNYNIFVNLVNKNKDFVSGWSARFYDILNNHRGYKLKLHLMKNRAEFFFNNFYNIYVSCYNILSTYKPKLNYIINKNNKKTDNQLIFSSFVKKYETTGDLFKIIPIKFNKYSLIFNLYLNIIDIKEDWSYLLLNNENNYNQLLFNDSFNNYYYYGHSNYKNFNILEAYRIFISLLFQYYNNFLYKLSRYLYILNMKNYTVLKFIERFFNIKSWLFHFYIKFKVQLLNNYSFGKSIENKFYKQILFRKNKYSNRVRRIEIAPFWFIFYKYIKMFIYFLLNKYYTKDYLIKWWLDYKLNLNFFFKLMLFYYDLKYKLKFSILYNCNYILFNYEYIKYFILDYMNIIISYYIYLYEELKDILYLYNLDDYYIIIYYFNFILLDFFKFFDSDIINYDFIIYNYNLIQYCILKSIYFFSSLYDKFIFSLNYIMEIYIYLINIINLLFNNKLNIYIWYFNIIFKSHIFDYIIKLIWFIDFSKIKLFIKIFILKINFNINFNLNNFILYKFYIKNLLEYYINILFKIKNKIIYFKSNYFNFRNPRALNKARKYKTRISRTFLNVKTRRNYNSFYNLTFNSFFFKNLYKFNLNTYIYIWNNYDIKLNIKLLFSPFIFLKYNFGNYILFLYWLIYLIFLIFIYIFYKQFFNLFFFSKKIKQVNVNTQYNWDLFIKKKVIKILKASTKEKALFYNYIFKKKYFKNYYFIFIDKFYKYFNESLYLKSFWAVLNDGRYYKNLKKYININNNVLLDISKQKLFINFAYIYNNKLLESKRFYNLFGFNFFIYKKENKKYYLSSNSYIYSNNMFYFFIFYWLFLIPLFFIEYILYRYHLRGHITKKYKLIILSKVFLDNFKNYVKLVKLLGDQVFHHKFKSRYVRNNLNSYLYRRKRKVRKNYFFKWDRLNRLYLRMSPLGSYYYWFSHINKWHYFICYYKYFFNSIYKSYYIKYFSFIYLLLCYIIYKRYCKYNNKLYNIKYKIFNFYKIKNLLNIIKLK